jgi:hypothetical protein
MSFSPLSTSQEIENMEADAEDETGHKRGGNNLSD